MYKDLPSITTDFRHPLQFLLYKDPVYNDHLVNATGDRSKRSQNQSLPSYNDRYDGQMFTTSCLPSPCIRKFIGRLCYLCMTLDLSIRAMLAAAIVNEATCVLLVITQLIRVLSGPNNEVISCIHLLHYLDRGLSKAWLVSKVSIFHQSARHCHCRREKLSFSLNGSVTVSKLYEASFRK